MKMGRKRFTAEEIKELEVNPYTLSVTENRLTITLAAKEKVLELYEANKTRRQIAAALGYDFDLLGEERMKNMIRGIRREAESASGLHEGYARTDRKRMSKEEIEELECDPASYAKLKNEVVYLRQEVEFLKKISQQVISGKRGK